VNEAVHKDSEAPVDPRIDLAVQRTELAGERTLLAWMRTVIGLMGSGVAFDKGTQLLHEARVSAGTALVRNGHFVGLTLTGVSTLLLAFVTWDYWRNLCAFARIKTTPSRKFRPVILGSVFVLLLGIAVFIVLVISK
jgi:uncharacterized membrane protein YidH (DUF202 family)